MIYGLYLALMIVMAFTGFGQMPLFARYYISAIPGLGWSADFYITHAIHYMGAALLLALVGYAVLSYFLNERRTLRLTASSYVRIFFLGGLVLTGILRVLKNKPEIFFSPGLVMFIDLAHLGFMFAYLIAALIFILMKSGWAVERNR
ncbi:MAG: FeS-binding protein [Deltaproteobacteria bacterium]|nr:FeS-binding protein [Deltaproteobacteria bacterium]